MGSICEHVKMQIYTSVDRPLPGLREEEPLSRLSTPVHRINALQMSSNDDRKKKIGPSNANDGPEGRSKPLLKLEN